MAKARVKLGPAKKKKRLDPGLCNMTKRWREVWATKCTWDEGIFYEKSELMGVLCTTCIPIDGSWKVMVLKNNTLEKHKEKRACIEDGVILE